MTFAITRRAYENDCGALSVSRFPYFFVFVFLSPSLSLFLSFLSSASTSSGDTV